MLIFKYNPSIIKVGRMQKMPLELKVIVGEIGHSLRVTIPKDMAEALDIEKGDIVGLRLTDHEIIMRKIKRP